MLSRAGAELPPGKAVTALRICDGARCEYRSVIFYQTEEQRKIAQEVIDSLTASKRYKKPIVTELLPAMPFYPAEYYHQDYLQKHPGGYCHVNLSLASQPLE